MSDTMLNISLSDLTAIKITCPQCHASAEFPVARLRGDPPERCFHCRGEWFAAESPGQPHLNICSARWASSVPIQSPDVECSW